MRKEKEERRRGEREETNEVKHDLAQQHVLQRREGLGVFLRGEVLERFEEVGVSVRQRQGHRSKVKISKGGAKGRREGKKGKRERGREREGEGGRENAPSVVILILSMQDPALEIKLRLKGRGAVDRVRGCSC